MYQGPERRAPQTQYPGEQEPMQHWTVDKKIPLGLIFAMLMQIGAAVWFFADIKKDVELLKADNVVLHAQDARNYSDMSEAMRQVREQFKELTTKLDRLIERGQK